MNSQPSERMAVVATIDPANHNNSTQTSDAVDMSKFHEAIFILLAGGAGALAQERLKPKGASDFDGLHASIAEHWRAQRWGKSFAATRDLLGVISARRAKAIRDALPAAPAGYTIVPFQEDPSALANPLMTTLAAGVGSMVEQNYEGAGKQIRIAVTVDSPMLQMFSMVIQNPALLQNNQELVKYTECTALLESDEYQVSLKFLLGESSFECTFQGENGDFALRMLDQKAITALAGVIAN